ncbi:MAG TPA: hypothetical protein VHS31_16495, partial [Tepidisphaeraceae bacterium]|nr:hypothetical protein [Tepidisphaeraceae bacterium]
MPDQIEHTPQVQVTAEKRSDRDLQRSALRDLVTLVGECQKTEIEIEQKHRVEQEEAKKKLEVSLSNIEHRLKNLQNQVGEKLAVHTERIGKEFEAKIKQFKETDVAMRDRMAADYEKSERELKQKLQQATWLADSVLEAAQAQLRDESNKLKREDIAQNEVLDGLENRAGVLMFSYGVNVATIPEAAVAGEIPGDAEAEAKQQRERAEGLLSNLETLSAPRLLTGPRPYLVASLLLIVAVMAAQLIYGSMPTWNQVRTLDLQWKQIGIFTGVAVLVISLAGVIVRFVGKMQAKKIFVPMREAIAISRQAGKVRLERAQHDREGKRQRAAKKRDLEVGAANERFGPLAAKIVGIRDKSLAMQASDDVKRHERAEIERDKDRVQLEEWRVKHLDDIRTRGEHDERTTRELYKSETSQSEQQYQETTSELQRRWTEGLARIQAPIEEQEKHQNAIHRDWNDAAWKNWRPPGKFAPTVQFGELEVDPKQLTEAPAEGNHSRLELPDTFSLPALLAFPSQASLLIQHDREGRIEALQTLQMVMTRLLTTQPPGRVRFTIIDPVGLGQNFAGFMHLADWDEALVGGRIWTSSEHIEQRLANLTEHMETVIQKYLRNEFETIDDYNAQAGELAEPYRFLVISDFPVGFTDESIRRLNSIAASGARCGVYTLIAHDRRVALPSGVNLDDIIAHSVNLAQEKGRFVWADEVFKQFPLALDGPAAEERLTEILTEVGQAAKAANRVEVSFAT